METKRNPKVNPQERPGNFHPASYPVVIRLVQGYLTASIPDFEIHLAERAELIDEAVIGRLILTAWKRCDQKLKGGSPLEQGRTPSSTEKILPTSVLDRPLSIREASREAGLSEATLRRACDRSELQADKTPGGHRRIRTSLLQAWIKNLRRTPQ